ncbi:MAG TPA: hypothetical protein PLA65_09030, partial [Spirochaetota bacterium]|nr:hypothetical protein [Spirochaetota bacterium]
ATEVEYNALHTARYQMCGVDDTIYNYFDRTSQCLPRALSVILQNIQGFTTAPELIERLSLAGFRGIDGESVKHCIRDLHESGLLITKDRALERLRAAPSGDGGQMISTAAWITKDRPESLIGSMESFIANFKKYGHRVRIFISDDSPDRAKSENLSDRLASIAKRESLSVAYMDLRERRKLRDTILEKAGPDGLPPAVLDFALFGLGERFPSYGANRNAVLLATAGDMILCSDDDVFCDLRVPNGDGYDLELATFNELDLRETHTDRESLLRAYPPGTCDILACHSRLLGRRISSILAGLTDNGRIKMASLLPADLTALLLGGGEVKTTITGVMGDSGLITPRYQLQMSGAAREHHVASESAFRELLLSREICQSMKHYAISSGSFFWGMNIGIDNRGMVPPFLPILRGEDITFSRLLPMASTNARIGALPVIILHDPVEKRRFETDAALVARPETCYLLYLLLNDFRRPQGAVSPRDRMIALGTHLKGIASLTLDDFEEYMKQLWLQRSVITTMTMESILNGHDYKPAFWAEYIERYMISIRDQSYATYMTATRDLYAGDEQAAAQSCMEIVGHVGELLTWWPVIFGAALELRGDRTASPAG